MGCRDTEMRIAEAKTVKRGGGRRIKCGTDQMREGDVRGRKGESGSRGAEVLGDVEEKGGRSEVRMTIELMQQEYPESEKAVTQKVQRPTNGGLQSPVPLPPRSAMHVGALVENAALAKEPRRASIVRVRLAP